MKKLFEISAIALASIFMAGAIVSCEKTTGGEEETDKTITVDPAELTFTAAEETKTVTVTCAVEWTATATTGSEWLTVTKGEGSFTVKAAANDGAERNGVITVSNGVASEDKTIAVKQAEDPGYVFIMDMGATSHYGTNGGLRNYGLIMTTEAGLEDGYWLQLDLYAPERAEDYDEVGDHLTVTPGTYNVQSEVAAFAIAIGSFSKGNTLDATGTFGTTYELESGSVEISGTWENYTMKIDVTNTNGDRIKGILNGPANITWSKM